MILNPFRMALKAGDVQIQFSSTGRMLIIAYVILNVVPLKKAANYCIEH